MRRNGVATMTTTQDDTTVDARPISEMPLYERTHLKPLASRHVIAEDGALSDSSDHHYSPCSGHKISSDIPKFDSVLFLRFCILAASASTF